MVSNTDIINDCNCRQFCISRQSVCDSLPLLSALFGEIKVPQAVYEEVCIANKAESQALKVYLAGKVCQITTSDNIEKPNGLGKGELEAICLY